MSNSSSSGDGGDDNLLWTALKVALIVIGAIVVLRFLFNIVWALMPFIVIAGLAYFAYRVFIASPESSEPVEHSDPPLLEHDVTDPVLDDEDPLEQKFRDLEAQEASRNTDG